jgi:hypothetical protein
MIPYDRHVLWHNTIDPEQNYGILAMEAVKPKSAAVALHGNGELAEVQVRMDASYLHIDITTRQPVDFAHQQLIVGFDTIYRDRGELAYAPMTTERAPSGMEFLATLTENGTSSLQVVPTYQQGSYRYAPLPGLSEAGIFEPMKRLINRARALADLTPIPAIEEASGVLRQGPLDNSANHWTSERNTISLRIPWGRLNVSDPSEGWVLDDERTYTSDPLRNTISVSRSDGIAVSVVLANLDGAVIDSLPATGDPLVMPWTGWNQPVYRERLKESHAIIGEYLKSEDRK